MINKEEFEKASFEENQKFIKEILRLATHNSFTKDDLLFLIKWQNEMIEKMKCCGNCRIRGAECVALEHQGILCGKTRDKWELAE